MSDTVLREIKAKPAEETAVTGKNPKRDHKAVLWSVGAFVLTLGGALVLGQQMTSSPLIGARPAPAATSNITETLLPEVSAATKPTPRRTSTLSPASPAHRSFDSTFARRPDAAPDGSRKWSVHAGKSAFDDSPRVVLALPAEKAVEGQNRKALPELVLRCEEGSLDAYVRLGLEPASALMTRGAAYSTEGRIRLDESDAESVLFTRSTDGESIFFPHPNVLLARLEKTKELLLEFVPSGERPQTTTFDLSGLKKVAPPLYEACRG